MGRKRRSEEQEDTDSSSPERLTRAERRQYGERSGALARRLLSLSDAELVGLPLPEAVREELVEARRIHSGGALRRHERRVAQVLRDEDLDDISAILDEGRRQSSEEARRFQRVEHWRERLLVEEGALEELRSIAPQIPPSELATLVADAKREREVGRPRGAGRELFRRLRAWLGADES